MRLKKRDKKGNIKLIYMKKLFLLSIVLGCFCLNTAAKGPKQKKADADTDKFRYELEYVKTAGTGMVNVKVWSYSKRPSIAAEQDKKNAVHGVIFKGFAGNGSTQYPLVKDPAALSDHAEFFDAFFADGGEYRRYVSNVVGPVETMKIGKEYKIATEVTVNKNLLRQHLEKANIIRSLNSGF